ncbi:MAG: shikimate kinase [Lachnospiraceae bacterium]|nr:shikimate kinase [Lachnospiraceae bacterium]
MEYNNKRKNIVLTGMPGSGKTSVGKRLAESLGLIYIDTDKQIEERMGVVIRTIFETKGEPCFREIEKAVIREVSSLYGCVIATGGGVILDPENMTALKEHGIIFLLDRRPELLEASYERPLADTKEKIFSLYKERLELYLSTADYVIDPDSGKDADFETISQVYLDQETVYDM